GVPDALGGSGVLEVQRVAEQRPSGPRRPSVVAAHERLWGDDEVGDHLARLELIGWDRLGEPPEHLRVVAEPVLVGPVGELVEARPSAPKTHFALISSPPSRTTPATGSSSVPEPIRSITLSPKRPSAPAAMAVSTNALSSAVRRTEMPRSKPSIGVKAPTFSW